MTKMKEQVYSSFEIEIRDLKKFYFDNSAIHRILQDNEKRKDFFKDQMNYLGQCLEFILDKSWITTEERYFGDWDPEFLLIGHFLEGLLRFILMKELSVESFFKKCFKTLEISKKPKEEENNLYYGKFKLFASLIDQIMLLPKVKKLTNKQSERIKDCLTYIRLQRNKHAHNLLKNLGPYISMDYQIFLLIRKLGIIFDIQIKKKVIIKLDKIIIDFNNQLKQSLRFEPVW